MKPRNRRSVILLFVLCILVVSYGCQTTLDNPEPEPEPEPVAKPGPGVYVAGFTNGRQLSAPCFWKNGERIALVEENGGYGRTVGVAVADGDLYIGGTIWEALSVLCYWKNGVLPHVSSATGLGWSVSSFAVSGKDVYFAGEFLGGSGGEFSVACFWKNGIQTVLSGISANGNAEARAIYLSGQDVYVCGYTANDSLGQVACYWKNGERVDLASGIYTNGICVAGSDVYVAGGSSSTPCYWKNGVRMELSDVDALAWVTDMCLSGSDVYIAGITMREVGPTEVPCYWKNGKRTDLSMLVSDKTGGTDSIYVSGNDVYVAGFTLNGADVQIPCYWKNGKRTDLGVVDASLGGRACGLVVISE